MATEKTVNYTAEQTAQVIADYTAGVSIETIAASIGKSSRSIIAKLSRMGAYKKKEYVTKSGEAPVKREKLADDIGELVRAT